MLGILGSGYPALSGDAGVATISVWGQFIGAIVMALIGFVPGYLVAGLFKMMGILRVGEAAEIAGLDPTKVPASAYPEGIPASASPAE